MRKFNNVTVDIEETTALVNVTIVEDNKEVIVPVNLLDAIQELLTLRMKNNRSDVIKVKQVANISGATIAESDAVEENCLKGVFNTVINNHIERAYTAINNKLDLSEPELTDLAAGKADKQQLVDIVTRLANELQASYIKAITKAIDAVIADNEQQAYIARIKELQLALLPYHCQLGKNAYIISDDKQHITFNCAIESIAVVNELTAQGYIVKQQKPAFTDMLEFGQAFAEYKQLQNDLAKARSDKAKLELSAKLAIIARKVVPTTITATL